MKACPKCQTKNQDSSQFCKKCGVKLSGSSFQDKKEKVLGEKKGEALLEADLSCCQSLLLRWQDLLTGSSRGNAGCRSQSLLSTEGS